jgi:hypothetical protein
MTNIAKQFLRDETGGLEEMTKLGGFVEDVAVPAVETSINCLQRIYEGANACLHERNENLRAAYCTKKGLLKGLKVAGLTLAVYASLC